MSHSVITLLSDLGTRDTSVTVAKAVFMRYAPGAAIVDISHNVIEYDLQQAAYLLLSAYKHFPKGTVHVVAVDVFAGSNPRMLLAEKDGYYFIAPDNGLLPLAFGTELEHTWLCFELSKPYAFSNWINNAGRVTELLQKSGTLPNGRLALPFEPYLMKEVRRQVAPKVMHDGVDCNILYIDRYENVVLDITKTQFHELMKNRPFKIKVMRTEDINTISTGYNDVPKGAPLCRFNSAGFLEIALNHAPATALLGLESNNARNLRYQTIKIFF